MALIPGNVCFTGASCHSSLSTSFLTTSRRLLQYSTPNGSAAGEPSETPSSPTSPPVLSSQSSSNVPSPVRAPNPPGTQMWSLDADLNSNRAATLCSVPSPSALQDSSSQDTQSSGELPPPPHWCNEMELILLVVVVVEVAISLLLFDDHLLCLRFLKTVCLSVLAAQDGDSVIIVNEQRGKKQESARLVFICPDCVLQYITSYC